MFSEAARDPSLSVSRLLRLLSLFTLHIPFAGCYLEQ